MFNSKFLLHTTLFFLITVITCLAQEQITTGKIRGFVTDTTNGERIGYANVFVKGTTLGAPSNSEGYYFIPSIPAGKQTIIFSFLGYEPKVITLEIIANKTLELDVQLKPSSVQLQELNVVGEMEVRPNETDLGIQKITAREIEMQPVGAEPDIFRVLQTAPGVNTTGDVTSKYYVRGGGGDQNLILLNGAPIYNPFHALGIFSVIDPEMISILEFHKGGFESEYGGRLSSILNIETRDGNKKNYQATANASLLAGRVSVEGPIPYGSFLVTGRKSYYADILEKYLNNDGAPFDFYDISFKANYGNPDIDPDGKFVVHGFISGDEVKYDDPFIEDFSVSNKIFGFNWNKVWSNPLFSKFVFAYSGYKADVNPKLSNSKPRTNEVSDITANLDFTYMYDSKDEFRFGLQNRIVNTSLQLTNLYGVKTNYAKEGWEMSVYSNYKFLRWDHVGFDIGVRAILTGLSEKRPFLLEPRMKVTYRPVPFIALKAAFGSYSQEIATVSNENELISIFEPWIIIPDYVNSGHATHYIAGIKFFFSEKMTFELEGYYKDLSNLIDLNNRKYNSLFGDYINVEGEAYGLEALAKFQPDMMFISASYTLSWAYKTRDGEKYHPRYDTRHSVNLLAGFDLGSNWKITSNWSLRSGMPFTPIIGFYDRPEVSLDPILNINSFLASTFWDGRNTGRLPFYHRLDFSVSKKTKIYNADVTFGASVLNAYNRKNIYYYDKDSGERVNMLPVFPSAYIKVEI
ncbi:MAG: TonB-dependent receptor [Melioribacteraceae bacterium]|nr:MAG: TonB-dependent receptor [Melioribacteraceae bacterium]